MTSVNEPLRGGALPGVPYQNAAYLAERYGPAYRWLVTITGMMGVVSMVLAMTTVNVAVPDVMGAFGIGQDKAQWMSSAYMATMTAGMLINAWLSGVLGERRSGCDELVPVLRTGKAGVVVHALQELQRVGGDFTLRL